MRYHIAILLCLLTYAGHGQQVFPHSNATAWDWFKGMVAADGGVRLPTDIPPLLPQADSVGLMYYSPDDSTVYIFTGSQWWPVGASRGSSVTPGAPNNGFQYDSAGSFAGSHYLAQENRAVHDYGPLYADDTTLLRGGYTKIGTVSGKLSFYGASPVTRLSGDALTSLITLGLVSSGYYSFSGISGLPTTLGGYGITDGVHAADSGTLYATPYRVDSGVRNTRTWANSTFLSSYTVDSTVFATKKYRQKGIDSVTAWANSTFLSSSGTVPIANGGTNKTSYTTGSIPFFDGTRLNENNNNLYWNNSTKSLSVNTNGDLSGTNTINVYGQIDCYGANGTQGYINDPVNMNGISISTSRGTGLSPTASATGDTIGTEGYWGYTGSSPAYKYVAGIVGKMAGVSSNLGGELHFYTVPDNSNTPADAFDVLSTGHVTMEGVTFAGATGTGSVVCSSSPGLTGTPTAPTPSTADNSTTIATTAHVKSAIIATSVNGLPLASGSNTIITPASAGKILYNSSLTSTTSAINTLSVIVAQTPAMSASYLTAGSVIRITLYGTCTSTAANTSTFRVYYGTAGTTSDGVVCSVNTSTAATSGTTIPFSVVIQMTITGAPGSSVTHNDQFVLTNYGTTGIYTSTTPQQKTPTSSNMATSTDKQIISVGYQSTAVTTTVTFQQALIEILKQ